MLKKNIVVKAAMLAFVVALATSSLALAKQLPKSAPKAATSTAVSAQVLLLNWKAYVVVLKIDNAVLTRIWRALDSILGRLSKRPAGHLAARAEMSLREVAVLLGRAQAIVTAHAGFDASGNVTDAATAQKSVAQLSAILRELRGGLMYKLGHLKIS